MLVTFKVFVSAFCRKYRDKKSMYVCNNVSKGGPEPLIVSLYRHALKPFFFGEKHKMIE